MVSNNFTSGMFQMQKENANIDRYELQKNRQGFIVFYLTHVSITKT